MSHADIRATVRERYAAAALAVRDPESTAQVYVGVDLAREGLAAIYVRTEKRPGDDHERHLLIMARDRVVLERWEDPEDFGER